jgi:hypothetical protein
MHITIRIEVEQDYKYGSTTADSKSIVVERKYSTDNLHGLTEQAQELATVAQGRWTK